MRNESEINPNLTDPETQPSNLPSVGTSPGWKSSEGQMTFLFVAISMVLTWLGRPMTTDQIQNGYEMIMGIIQQIGPLIAAGGVLWNYITSRGKAKSNAINATAAMSIGGDAVGLSGKWGKVLDIGKAVAGSGIIPGTAGTIAQSILGTNDNEEVVTVLKDHERRIRGLESR
jgi:hypothetical protein